MTLKWRSARGFWLALILGTLPAGPARAAGDSAARWPRVSQLIGMTVEDRGGWKLGKLWDLAADPRTGRLPYAIVASGGFLGVGRKLRPVPARFVSAATAKRDTLELTFSKEYWENAPQIRRADIASPGDR